MGLARVADVNRSRAPLALSPAVAMRDFSNLRRARNRSGHGARRCASLAWPWTLVLVTAFVRRAFLI
jgi:hypothetical protein